MHKPFVVIVGTGLMGLVFSQHAARASDDVIIVKSAQTNVSQGEDLAAFIEQISVFRVYPVEGIPEQWTLMVLSNNPPRSGRFHAVLAGSFPDVLPQQTVGRTKKPVDDVKIRSPVEKLPPLNGGFFIAKSLEIRP